MPLILGTNSIKDTGFNVANSCRFNDGSSDHMLKTASAGNRRTFTFSTWFKRGQLSTNQQFFTSYSAANAGGFAYMQLEIPESGVIGDRISLEVYGTILLKTNQVLRDPSAWYHLVIAVDTTNATANNRCRMYLNGTEITSFATRNNPDENFDFAYNQDSIDLVLASNNYNDTKGNYFDGYLAETVWIDGTQYAASDFGEFDDSGIWKPINVSGLTFGTNGFYLDYKASGNLGNDANGGTDLTEANLTAIDQSTDTCTNNFATLNPLNVNPSSAGDAFTEGNLKLATSNNSNSAGSTATMAFTKGKWYAEVKYTSATAWNGVMPTDATINGDTGRMNWYQGRTLYLSGSNTANWGSNVSAGDIVGIALDMDNSRVTISQGGQWWGGSSFNQAQPNTYQALTSGYDTWGFMCRSGSAASTSEWNFGSPPFAISSGNQDADGFGNFEFAVPSGYFALCTKNLAEYG